MQGQDFLDATINKANPVRIIDLFVESLNLKNLGFKFFFMP